MGIETEDYDVSFEKLFHPTPLIINRVHVFAQRGWHDWKCFILGVPIDPFEVMNAAVLSCSRSREDETNKKAWLVVGMISIPLNLFNCYHDTSTSRRDKKICGWRDTQSYGKRDDNSTIYV
ncbi:hypothetical protein OCU04_004256 [Sclerotinia nivalis]|uniref:Uncharacterized protein n=1 Tax=Sclerotinia nivalis TaxID=352851 RepID=A0A9X0DM91_9HELO|nr:hypothetical protein OCU04_004256 [Sclerotinia nivalis]